MFSAILNKVFQVSNTNTRNISNSTIRFENAQPSRGHLHKVNNFEKKVLVWTGKFKNIEEVPASIAPEIMEKARSRMRIRVANWMMAATLVACGVMVYMGKKSHKSGDSLEKRNLDMHKRYNEKFAKKEEEERK